VGHPRAGNAFNADDTYDAWSPMDNYVKEYNAWMKKLVRMNRYLILDESMSPFKPRADKYGGLPHMSYIMRKPMPFGTEFKTCCTACGIMTFMEIQKGANKQQEVRAHSNYSDYPAKASMTLRMCENMTPGMTAIGDADFGSIHSAYGLALDGKGSILNIKTAHAFIPKAEIEEALKGTAAGTSMVWTTTIDRIRFNVIGYKYARFKKVQIFIATVGAVTSDWKPYIAKFI
jgi:hypothetical protein